MCIRQTINVEPKSEQTSSHPAPIDAVDDAEALLMTPGTINQQATGAGPSEVVTNSTAIQSGNDAVDVVSSAPVNEDIHGDRSRVIVPPTSRSYPRIPIEHPTHRNNVDDTASLLDTVRQDFEYEQYELEVPETQDGEIQLRDRTTGDNGSEQSDTSRKIDQDDSSQQSISAEQHEDVSPTEQGDTPAGHQMNELEDPETQDGEIQLRNRDNSSEQSDTSRQDSNQQLLSAEHEDVSSTKQGDTQDVGQQNHTGNQPAGNRCQKHRIYCLIIILLSVLFSLGALAGGISYAIIEHPTARPQSSEQCDLYYILSLDSVQCGEANSRDYSKIQIKGALQSGDTLQGTVKTWVIPEGDLKLFTCNYAPSSYNETTSSSKRILLPQLQNIYMWMNSIVYGNCCLVNHGSTEATVSLNIFNNNSDIQSFLEKGIMPKSDVLSESIKIPPHGSQCFSRWGPESPLKVNVSSYYYIGVSVPANIALYSNVTITQRLVNTSGYGPPHYVGSDNFTVFTLSSRSGNNTAICEAPLSLQAPSSGVGAESLHVQTCIEPKQAQAEKPTIKYIAPMVALFTVFVLMLLIALISLYFLFKCLNCRRNYEPIQ